MSLQCAVCSATDGKDGQVVDAVCHHCGKPLCTHHRILILDEQFANRGAPTPRNAYHCATCRQTYHARSHVVRPTRPLPSWRTLRGRLPKLPWKRKARSKR